jgi:hypothetical protein
LFGETVLSIPLGDIKKIEKKKNFIGLESMIEVTTKKGDLTFTSFVFRDKAFSILHQLLTNVNPEYKIIINGGRRLTRDTKEILGIDSDDVIQLQHVPQEGNPKAKKLSKAQKREIEFQKRNKTILKEMIPLSKYDQPGYQYQFAVDYNAFFRMVFCKVPLTYKEKSYSCFTEAIETKCKTIELDIGDWNQEVPQNISRKKDLLGVTKGLEKEYSGSKKVEAPIPFIPKKMDFTQKNKLYFLDENRFSVHLEMIVKPGIPFADAFRVKTCLVVKNEGKKDGKDLVSCEVKYYIEWYKETMLKTILTKAAKEEIDNSGAAMKDIMLDLIKAGTFEKLKEELALKDKVEESEEEDGTEEENEENTEEGEEQEKEKEVIEEMQNQKEEELRKEEIETDDCASGFKIPKKAVISYFFIGVVVLGYVCLKFA